MRRILIPIALTLLAAGLSACGSKSTAATQLSSQARTKSARINIQLAMAYLGNKQNALAKAKLIRAMKLAPNLPESNYAFGYYYLQLKQPDKAEPYYQKALKLAPKDPNVLNSYGVFLCDTGKYELAEKAFLNAASVPDFTAVGLTFQNAGDCAYKSKDNTHAYVYFEKAFHTDPRLPVPYLRLAEIDFANGKIKSAQRYLQGFNDLADPTMESIGLGIKIAEKQGNKSKAASLRLQMNSLKK